MRGVDAKRVESEAPVSPLLEPFVPTTARPFDLRLAGHLAQRVGFGMPLATRRRMVRVGVERSLQWLRRRAGAQPVDVGLEAALATDNLQRIRAYRMWRVLAGPDGLQERMSLCWHDHFATSAKKVKRPRRVGRQLALFDALGLGRFDALLEGVSRDPAMIEWLDSHRNVVGKPNENFARELFELFALGRRRYGSRAQQAGTPYSEADIREAARAFTGYSARLEDFRMVRASHDRGVKRVFGSSGALGGSDIVKLAVRHPDHATYLADRLLRWFVHPEPTASEIDAVAACYSANQRDLGATLDVLVRSELFFSERAFRSKIKSPVDFVVGAVRCLGGRASPARLARTAAGMGQALLEPPSVEGWPGEDAWVTSATWLLRTNFAAEVHAGPLRSAVESAFAGIEAPRARADHALSIVLDGVVSNAGREAIRDFARRDGVTNAAILHAVYALPEAQLS